MGVAMSSVEPNGRDAGPAVDAVDRDPVRELLSEYREILARAERLPWVLWSRTRAPHTSLLARVWRLPRLTLGTSHMVLFHVTRSIDALMRVFAAKAALGELDAEGHRQREMITTFRASLRPVRWRWFIVGGVVAVVLLGRLLLDIVAHSFDSLAFGRGAEAIDEERLVILRATLEGLASMSSSASGSSVNDFATRLSQAGATGLFVFAATIFAAAYCVLRPASTAFRLKRQLFNLADEPEDAIYRTTTTWHVRRTTGLYLRERDVHAAAGVENAKEKPFDLGLSLFAAVLVAWTFASFAFADESISADRTLLLVLVLLFFAARIGWLHGSHVARRRALDPWELPASGTLTVTRRVVDVRSRSESFAFGASMYLAPIAWYRLSVQLARLETESSAQRGRARQSVGRFFSLPSAAAVVLLTPAVLAVRVWRIQRLAQAGWRAPGLRWLMVATVGSAAWWVLFAVTPADNPLIDVAFGGVFTTTALGLAATQAAQNQLVRSYAEPVPCDVDSDTLAAGAMHFNPAPGWPAPPPGASPEPGWQPDASWPRPPRGWRLWTPVTAELPSPLAADVTVAPSGVDLVRRSHRAPV
jgi:hypothetical protein